LLWKKLGCSRVTTVIENRIDILVKELNLDKEKILLWGFVHVVLATCWSIQEDGSYNETFLGQYKFLRI